MQKTSPRKPFSFALKIDGRTINRNDFFISATRETVFKIHRFLLITDLPQSFYFTCFLW